MTLKHIDSTENGYQNSGGANLGDLDLSEILMEMGELIPRTLGTIGSLKSRIRALELELEDNRPPF